jgi:hypothetical protein
VPRRGRISHTHPVWLWGCSPSKILSPGPVFYGTKWLPWRPHRWGHTLHSRCRINKGLIKRGRTIDLERSRCKVWFLWPTPYTYIHACTYSIVLNVSVIFLIGIVRGGVQFGPLGTAATNRTIVLWWWRNWWNDDWQEKPKYSEKTCPSAALSTTNPTYCPDANPGHRGGKPATNCLSYGTANLSVNVCYLHKVGSYYSWK